MSRKASLIRKMDKQKLEVYLYPKHQRYLEGILATGDYTDMSDAVREALREKFERITKPVTSMVKQKSSTKTGKRSSAT